MANTSTRGKKAASAPAPSFKEEATPVAAAPATATATSVDAEVVESHQPETSLDRMFTEAEKKLEELASMRVQLKETEIFLKNFMKEAKKTMKAMEKASSRKQRRSQSGASKIPSGFAKKAKINDTFKAFLESADVQKIVTDIQAEESKKDSSSFEALDAEGKISRPSATKILNAYIKSKNLQDPSAKKNFKPDAKLKKLLTPLSADDTAKGGYSYFNLQRYTSHLYLKE